MTQDRSRLRSSGLFTLLFLSACGAIGAVHLMVMIVAGQTLTAWDSHAGVLVWTLPLLAGVFIAGVVVRFYAIRLGGGGIAKELGGRRLHPGSDEPSERRILDTVEELAVALGLPLPEVWFLDREAAINAFVLGDEPARAVVGVTRGAVERLTQDEFRAVLCHEFSHVVTGHMRLNFQLLAWVQGLLFLGLAGRMLFGRLEGARRLDKRSSEFHAQPLPVLGVLLIVLGSIFSAFGRFLQGAICRDQEFMADRAAVDLLGSREPLVRALRKIGGHRLGGVLRAPTAIESSHLFFCQASQGLAASAFPSHPLIEDRIRAIEPDWDGQFLLSEAKVPQEDDGEGGELSPEFEESSTGSSGTPVAQYAKGLLHVVPHTVFPAAALESLGCGWSWSRIEQGRLDRASLRSDWVQLTLSRDGVKRLVFEMCRQSDSITDGVLARSTAAQKMLLLDLSMPLLRRMSLEDFVGLNRRIRREVRRGESPDLLRYLFAHIFARRMQICLGLRETLGVVYEEFSSIWQEAQVLVSLMSREGAPTPSARSSAYEAAWKWLGLEMPQYQDRVSMLELGKTLDTCAQASPMLKKKLLAACGIAAGYEGHVAEREMVILRLFADALGTPLPNLG